ncbi:MAG TPA: AzlD domain-containing protein [Anaerolineae bacterium]|nr:AzlD domain-containing protein [Anaerolineae bacterium]
MSEQALWAIVLSGMLVTYAMRLSFIALIPIAWLPPLLQRGLRFVPPAILAAIITPELLRPFGVWDFSFQNHRLLAGLLAAMVAWRFRNTWLTIGVGMGALWLLSLVS